MKVITSRPRRPDDVPDSVAWRDETPCSDCGAMCESGYFDSAYHECSRGVWNYLIFMFPRSRLHPDSVEDTPPDRIIEDA